MFVLLLFAFLAGIFTTLSPCILPILPAVLAVGTLEGRWRPLGVVFGLVIAFSFFTLFFTALVSAFGFPANLFRYAAIALILFFGLVMVFPRLSDHFSRFLSPLAQLGSHYQKQSNREGFLSGIGFGLALGLVWTPCAGPILAAVTTLVATQSLSLIAVLLTVVYSIGAAVPLFCIAYGGQKVVQSSHYLASHAEGLRRLFGGMLILVSIAIALQWDLLLQSRVSRYLPTPLIEDNASVQEELDKIRGKSVLVGEQAPGLVGITHWLHSPPLSFKELKGKVVLIDFWTYSCINCLRTLPSIKKWWADYQDKGLVVIGVHTPEFEFEKDTANVEKAAKTLGVNYPIAQDNQYETWSAFRNRYWPAHYLIDQNGRIRYLHFGEGAYIETENEIRKLLGLSPLNEIAIPLAQRPLSPETYLGTQRATSYSRELHVIPEQAIIYDYQTPLQLNEVGLKGSWKIESERITAEGDDSYLEGNFLGKQIYLVLSGASQTPLNVYVDGKLTQEIVVSEDRKYDLFNGEYGRHLLSLKIPQGVNAYAFTFGDEP